MLSDEVLSVFARCRWRRGARSGYGYGARFVYDLSLLLLFPISVKYVDSSFTAYLLFSSPLHFWRLLKVLYWKKCKQQINMCSCLFYKKLWNFGSKTVNLFFSFTSKSLKHGDWIIFFEQSFRKHFHLNKKWMICWRSKCPLWVKLYIFILQFTRTFTFIKIKLDFLFSAALVTYERVIMFYTS